MSEPICHVDAGCDRPSWLNRGQPRDCRCWGLVR